MDAELKETIARLRANRDRNMRDFKLTRRLHDERVAEIEKWQRAQFEALKRRSDSFGKARAC
ncbi:MAG: hypothetical protein HDQ88_05830 [Clostridia bacterium]|nr:hypothetical protein [Clostridia bacterium]